MLNDRVRIALKLLSVSLVMDASNIFGMDPNQDPNKNQDSKNLQNLQQQQSSNNDTSTVSQTDNLNANNVNVAAQFFVFNCLLALQMQQAASQTQTVRDQFFTSLQVLLPPEKGEIAQVLPQLIRSNFNTAAEYNVLIQILNEIRLMLNQNSSDNSARESFWSNFRRNPLSAIASFGERFAGVGNIRRIISNNRMIVPTLLNVIASLRASGVQMSRNAQFILNVLDGILQGYVPRQ